MSTASCGPSPVVTSSSSASPSPDASRQTSISPPAPSPQNLALEGRIKLEGLIALAPAGDGVWYIRGREGDAIVGHATATASTLEAPAGPAPVSLAAAAEGVLLLEGAPTLQGFTERVNVLELLDPATLAVKASVSVPGVPTGLAAEDASIWVVTAEGVVYRYAERSLHLVATVRTQGRGPGRVVVALGAVWIINTGADAGGAPALLVHRINPKTDTVEETTAVAKSNGIGVIGAGRTHVWVASGASDLPAGQGRLVRFSASGSSDLSVPAPIPIAVAEYEGSVWWLTGSGSLGAVSDDASTIASPLNVGVTGSDITTSGDRLWIASEDLLVFSAPTP